MSIDSTTPSLKQFADLAAQSVETRTIRSESDGLSATRLPTWASVNRKTMRDFISALRAEFGSQIADAADDRLAKLTKAGRKPLKAFMVRQAIDLAARTVRSNLNVKERFLSGIDPAHSFDASFDALADKEKITDPDLRAHIKEVARSDFKAAMAAAGTIMTPEIVESEFFLLSGNLAMSDMRTSAALVENMPGSLSDKYDVLRATVGEKSVGRYVINLLPQCRMLQPDGQLSRETIWQAALESPMPETITEGTSDEDFTKELSEAISGDLSRKVHSREKAQGIMGVLGDMSLKAAIEIARDGRPVRTDDYLSADALLNPCRARAGLRHAEAEAAADLCRVSTVNVHGESVDSGAIFHLG